MAQPRLPAPVMQKEVIDALKEDLANWVNKFIVEQNEVEELEAELLAEKDTNYEAPAVLPEESAAEAAYEKFAPYFVSAKSFLGHVLEQNKDDTKAANKNLYDMLGMSHEQFRKLSEEAQRKYLLDICVISAALLQDLRVLENKYVLEIDQCLTIEIIKEITIEKVVNGATTILFDMALYHPDHQKEFAEYRQQLYSSIGATDLSIHQFFITMKGHVDAAVEFVKTYRQDLKHGEPKVAEATDVKEDKAEAKEAEAKEKPAGDLTQAIKMTAFAPPPASAPEAATPAAKPAAKPGYSCAIL